MNNKGQFAKGNSGRPKGAPNKVTGTLRKMLGDFLTEQWPSIQDDFKKLKPRDRVFMYEKLLNFSLPKYSNVNLNLDSMDDEELERIAEIIREKHSEEN